MMVSSFLGAAVTSRLRRTAVAALIAWSAAAPAAGQPPQPAVPAEFDMEGIERVAQLACDFRYPEKALEEVVQGGQVELRVSIRSDVNAVKYALTSVVQEQYPDDQARDYIRQVGALVPRELGVQNFLHVRTYDVKLQIDADAPPRPYDLVLTFQAPNATPQRRTVRLFVGAKDAEKYVDASADPQPPRIAASADSKVTMFIANRFPTYALTLTKIRITSYPPGVIEDVDRPLSVRVPSGSRTRVEVPIKGKRWLGGYLWPDGTHPRLNVLLSYSDGFRENVERLPEIRINFLLDDPVLKWGLGIGAIVAGALFGTYIRAKVVRPRSERRVSPGTRVATSLVLTLVIMLVIVVMQVEIVAASLGRQLSLHSPPMALLISFALGLYDPGELVEIVKRKVSVQGSGGRAGGAS